MLAIQLKSVTQRETLVERVCPEGSLLCLLIKDEVFLNGEQNSVLRSLVPEKFPSFIIAQIVLQATTGWKSWLQWFIRAQCHAVAFVAADYQQIMLAAPFLTGSLRKADDGVEHGRVLSIGLGARSIANYIHYHLFRVEIDELIVAEKDRYLDNVWLANPTWNYVATADIREKDYNVVFIDACLNIICPPLRTIETATHLNRTLKDNGVLVVSINAPRKNLLHRTLKRVNDSLSKAYGCSIVVNRSDRTASLNKILLYWKIESASGCQKTIKSFEVMKKSYFLSNLSNK